MRHDGRCLRCDGQVEWQSDNEWIIRRFFDAFNSRDEGALAGTVDPAVTIRPALAAKGRLPAAMRGIPSVVEGLRTLERRFSAWSFDVRACEEHPGGRVMCQGSVSLTGLDGSSEAHDLFWAVRIREGRVCEMSSFHQLEAALQALGLTGR